MLTVEETKKFHFVQLTNKRAHPNESALVFALVKGVNMSLCC